jgi:hypothetical protein
MSLRRLVATTAVALAAVTSLAACGGEEPTRAETEGIYVNTGELKYQVQISRQLNPTDFEDRDYVTGVPAGAGLTGDEEWFGVFIRVFNKTDDAHESAQKFEIHDTTGKVYDAVALDTNVNRVAFRSQVVGPGDQNPVPGSMGRENDTQGVLLLFKIPVGAFANRPLELVITPPSGGDEATVDLDV